MQLTSNILLLLAAFTAASTASSTHRHGNHHATSHHNPHSQNGQNSHHSHSYRHHVVRMNGAAASHNYNISSNSQAQAVGSSCAAPAAVNEDPQNPPVDPPASPVASGVSVVPSGSALPLPSGGGVTPTPFFISGAGSVRSGLGLEAAAALLSVAGIAVALL